MKISYKTYFNDRLKEVDFHGKLTRPLYVQVTYNRQSIFFKSYYFDLFSKPRFFLDIPGAAKSGPGLDLVEKKEKEVIEFVIEENRDNFSLDKFRKAYDYYSVDVCDLAEIGFREYLFRFFWDDGSPVLGDLVKHGCKHVVAYDLVNDFRRNFMTEKYDKLVKNSFMFVPTYLPLYGFMSERKRWPETILTMKEFRDIEYTVAFKKYMDTYHPNMNVLELATEIINLPFNYKEYAEPPKPVELDIDKLFKRP